MWDIPTLPRMISMPDVKDIIRRAGGPAKLGRALGKDHSTIAKWTQVPAQHARAVAEAAGMSPEQVRPDVFGPANEAA